MRSSASRRVWVTQQTQDPGMVRYRYGFDWQIQNQPGVPRCTQAHFYFHHFCTYFEEIKGNLCYLHITNNEIYLIWPGAEPGGVRKRGPCVLSQVSMCSNALPPPLCLFPRVPYFPPLVRTPLWLQKTYASFFLWDITPSR